MHAGFSYGDPNAGVHAAFAVLAALYHRAKTGESQYSDMSQWESSMGVIPEGILEYTMNGREPERIGNRDPWMAPHGIFKCLDRAERVMDQVVDQFVSIVAADDEDWKRLARAIGCPELANDAKFATFETRRQNEDELESIIEQWTSTRSAADVQDTLQEAGIAAFVVADNKYLSEEDPHLQARDDSVYPAPPHLAITPHPRIPSTITRPQSKIP